MWIFKDYRLLSDDEHQELLSIRNQEHIRNASHSSDIITMEEHLKWLKRLSTCRTYFALIIDEKIYGGIYYIKEKNSIKEWGMFFNKNTAPLITLLANYIFIEYMFQETEVLYSEILLHNQKALEFNQYLGITIKKQTSISYKMILTKQQWQDHKKNLTILHKRVKKIKYLFVI